MSSVMLSVTCNSCKNITPNYWVTRNHKGVPSLEGAVCNSCGLPNRLTRNWNDQEMQVINVPLEDGRINRFEASYVNENGKKIIKKFDPKEVERHFQNNSKGN